MKEAEPLLGKLFRRSEYVRATSEEANKMRSNLAPF